MAKDKKVVKEHGKPHVSAEVFIRAVESSNSGAEVAQKTGLKVISVLVRMSNYRKKGIPLRNFPRGGGAKLDVAGMKALVAQLNQG